MHYYIDGYNLLFRLLRAGDDLQEQRERIIQDLSAKIQFIGLDATVVFDAQYQVGESTKTHLHNMEVLFTAEGDTADDFIISELKCARDPRQETVVTSDKKLAWRARRRAALTTSVEEFIDWLNRRCKNKTRRLKEEKRPPTLPAAPKPPPRKEAAIPSKKALVEECHDYYASVFEEAYRRSASEEPPKKKAKSGAPARKKTPKPKPEEDPRSDMERWLEIFEGRESGIH